MKPVVTPPVSFGGAACCPHHPAQRLERVELERGKTLLICRACDAERSRRLGELLGEHGRLHSTRRRCPDTSYEEKAG